MSVPCAVRRHTGGDAPDHRTARWIGGQVVWLMLMVTAPATAQHRFTVDAGMGTDRELPGASAVVAPALGWTGRWWSVEGSGRYAARADAGRTFIGTIDAASWLRLTPALTFEAGTRLGTRSRSWTGAATGASGRLAATLESRIVGGRLALERGAAQGRAAHVPLSSTQGTAWARIGPMQLEILGRQTTLGEAVPGRSSPRDTLVIGTPGIDSTPAQQYARYTDLGGTLSGSHGALSASVAFGHRFGTTGDGDWWKAEGIWWMTPRLGLVLQGGESPPDLLLGGGGGRFFTLAFRAALRGSPTAAPAGSRPSAPEGRTLLLTRRPGGGTVLAIHAPATSRVELMADFTDWVAVELVRTSNDWFELAQPIPPGTHQANVRYDGGAWTPPPGSPTMHDEFEGVVGVIRAE
jgi:hypothetical protein